MNEYKVIKIGGLASDTESKLNHYARNGWKLVVSYAKRNEWLIMEREKEVCSKCKK